MKNYYEELVIDRWDRLGINYNLLSDDKHGYFVNHNKKGGKCEKSYGWSSYIKYPFTKLRQCELCLKLSTPKKIQERDVENWDLAPYISWPKNKWKPSKTILCMGCRNNVKPIYVNREKIIENKILINKLKREMTKWRKLQIQDS